MEQNDKIKSLSIHRANNEDWVTRRLRLLNQTSFESYMDSLKALMVTDILDKLKDEGVMDQVPREWMDKMNPENLSSLTVDELTILAFNCGIAFELHPIELQAKL
jgi:hypothetical protein